MHANAPSHRAIPRRAFTLVEILTVLVILGIVSAAIVPQIGSRDDQKAVAASRVLVADLLYAQNRAIARQRTTYVQFDAAADTYRILDVVAPATYVKNPVDGSDYQATLGNVATNRLRPAQIHTAAFDGQSILAFDAMGMPYSYNNGTGALIALSSGSIAIRSNAHQVTVTVAPFSGEIRVQ